MFFGQPEEFFFLNFFEFLKFSDFLVLIGGFKKNKKKDKMFMFTNPFKVSLKKIYFLIQKCLGMYQFKVL